MDEIEQDKKKFLGQDISVIINQMRYAAIDAAVKVFSDKWFLRFEDVRYEALNFKDGSLANENKLKDSADYTRYKEEGGTLPKFKFRKAMIDDFREALMAEIGPLIA